MKGSVIEYSQVIQYFENFYNGYEAGSIFMLESNEGKKYFIQFAITEIIGNSATVTFGLPRLDWCYDSYDSLIEDFESAGLIVYTRSNSKEMKFIEIVLNCTLDEPAPPQFNKIINICLDTFYEFRPNLLRCSANGVISQKSRLETKELMNVATEKILSNPDSNWFHKQFAKLLRKMVFFGINIGAPKE